MPWGFAIAAGATLIGSSMSASAANNAANTQAGAATQAAQLEQQTAQQSLGLQRDIYEQGRSDLSPWRLAGNNALQQLQYQLGIGPAPPTNNLAILSANDNARLPVGSSGGIGSFGSSASSAPPTLTPGMMAAQQTGPHSQNGLFGGNGYAAPLDIIGGSLFGKKNASPIQDIAGALAAGHPIKDSDWAKAGYGPGGSLAAGQRDPMTGQVYQPPPTLDQANPTTPGHGTTATGAPAPVYGPAPTIPGYDPNATFQQSPGYDFARSEGLRAVQNSAAARGMLNSGATLKAVDRFTTGLADQDYWNWQNRQDTQQNNWLARLQSLAGVGQTATNTGISAAQSFGANSGNILQSMTTGVNNANSNAAAARASGYVGSANAYSGGLNSLGAIAGNYLSSRSNSTPASTSYNPGTGDWTLSPNGF